jgi:type II secretory pathway pseudopilin PulG
MDAGLIGLIVAIVSGLASFALGRWWSRKRRAKKAQEARAAEYAAQSRQVRRAQARRRRG